MAEEDIKATATMKLMADVCAAAAAAQMSHERSIVYEKLAKCFLRNVLQTIRFINVNSEYLISAAPKIFADGGDFRQRQRF